jgi:catalase
MAKKSNNGAAKPNPKSEDLRADTKSPGEKLTTNQGVPLADDQNTLKAGVRGPSLLEDFHFREKITHFDHERIPERVVHARGAAAHGYFECTNPMTKFTKAAPFAEKGKRTPVFVRFSTVAGSRGSPDTPRDVRGFAVKFYTDDGVWDLVGNNMPVFFIQDAIKFPDFVHSVKPEPHNEIPQAASAHDTFYDFIGLTPESMHMMMWVMSDRALPRTFAQMQGFGIHTFRFVNDKAESNFVKFHFKPKKGVHSMVWDESQKLCGKDSDFQRRDLYESIEQGDFPEWEFGVQIVPEKDEHKFDFDLLDPTKIIPEEIVPVTPMGRLVLNRNPENFFAEVEQAAFHPGHIIPGIDFSNDPLLQGRLFSYIDTQIKRVGPNFAQIPINRPTCPVHNNQRDAESQQFIHKGRVAYFPNTLGGGCPAHSPEGMQAFSSHAEKMDGAKVRQRSPSFADHFSQATMFWNSMADWEKDHIVDAISFELNNCQVKEVKERYLNHMLANVADELAERVGKKIGITARKQAPKGITPEANAPVAKVKTKSSPALSMNKPADMLMGRKVAILAGEGVDAKQIADLKARLAAEGVKTEVIARMPGMVKGAGGKEVAVDRPAPNASSLFYDAVFIPGGESGAMLAKDALAVSFVQEAFMHCKTIAAASEAMGLLENAGIDPSAPGIITLGNGKDSAKAIGAFIGAMHQHRHFDRVGK